MVSATSFICNSDKEYLGPSTVKTKTRRINDLKTKRQFCPVLPETIKSIVLFEISHASNACLLDNSGTTTREKKQKYIFLSNAPLFPQEPSLFKISDFARLSSGYSRIKKKTSVKHWRNDNDSEKPTYFEKPLQVPFRPTLISHELIRNRT